MDIPAMKTQLGELEGLIAELKGKTSQTAEEKEVVRDLDAKVRCEACGCVYMLWTLAEDGPLLRADRVKSESLGQGARRRR